MAARRQKCAKHISAKAAAAADRRGTAAAVPRCAAQASASALPSRFGEAVSGGGEGLPPHYKMPLPRSTSPTTQTNAHQAVAS